MSIAATVVLSLLFAASLAAMAELTARWVRRDALVSWSPRHAVPWNGGHVLAGLVFYVMCQSTAAHLALKWSGTESRDQARGSFQGDVDRAGWTVMSPLNSAPERAALGASTFGGSRWANLARETPTAVASPRLAGDVESTAHPLTRLVAESENPVFVALALLSAVLVAPLAEEFFFRVLLGGWLEARESRWRRLARWLRIGPRGWLPIVGSALPFALAHARGAQPEFDVKRTIAVTVGITVANLLAVVLAAVALHGTTGASWRDLGWMPGWLWYDCRVGVQFALAILAPMYFLQFGLYAVMLQLRKIGWVSEAMAPDPVPIFLLAIVLGYLYYRTHRLTPSMFAHMAFNSASLTIVLLMAG